MTFLSSIFGRAVEDMESARRAMGRPVRARQAASSSSAAFSTGASTAVTSSGSSPTSTGSSGTDSSLTSSASITSGISASTVLPSNEIASTEPNGNVVLSLITPPPWTATSMSAYTAPGVNTTTKPPPPNMASTSSSSSSSSSASASTSSTSTYSAPGSWATAFGVPKNELTACKIDGKNYTDGPFCSPIHQQNLWIGYTYAITWNTDLFPINATNSVQLMYNDTALGNATVTPGIPSYQGYQDITVDEAWLQGADGNSSWSGQNVTLMMVSNVPGGFPPMNVTSGPTIALVKNPKTLPPVLIPKISNKYGLEIGLPIGLVAVIIILLAVCCAVKKNNGRFRDIKGSMTKDYMSRRARRGGGGRRGGGKGGEYDDLELESTARQAGYTDEPVKGGENAFRDEIRRQRDEDDVLIKRTYSSY